jgi:GNAT superfamily N-acetyltransferase
MRNAYARLAGVLSRRCGLRVFRFFIMRGSAESAAKPRSIELRQMGQRDVLMLCSDPAFDLAEDKVQAAFARGDLCIAAFAGDRVVAYCWIAFAPLPHLDGVWADFDNRGTWIYKSLVLPSHRGQGIAPALYGLARNVSLARGREFSVICVETHNAASIHAARSAGYGPCGYGSYVMLGRKLASWFSKRAKAVGLRFFIPA